MLLPTHDLGWTACCCLLTSLACLPACPRQVIILANAPSWLPILWKILRPMLNEVRWQWLQHSLQSAPPLIHHPITHSVGRAATCRALLATPQITAQKIRIANSADTYKAMLEFIDEEHIPVEYGGKLSYGPEPDACR